ncbi:hypothetical protein NE865_07087 [Phthorimaea operculella]|nr:hypothetical protein NE865_07087 [Phthorimaea operculella]
MPPTAENSIAKDRIFRLSAGKSVAKPVQLGFFGTIFHLILEQINDTKSAYNQVSELLGNQFTDDNAPTSTPDPTGNETTTESTKISRQEFLKILDRNLKGLARLRALEWREALLQTSRILPQAPILSRTIPPSRKHTTPFSKHLAPNRKCHASGWKTMSSRGRGYGGYGGRGGSYSGRGGGYRGSYRGNNRGSYEGRGGRGGGGYSSYNNDSRYNSSSGTRYSSSRDRIDDSYKKSYRSESSAAYSTRDYGGRSGSPERKRMRIEGSSSDRRSHDGGGHYGSSYGRQESYGGERRSFGGEDRRRSPTRESYRKPSGMGPPRDSLRTAMRPRAPRRSFRGRTMRSRATYRGAPRSRGAFASRRYGDRSLGYTRAFRPIKRGSSPVKSKDDEEASSTEEDWDADEKEEEIAEEKKEAKSKSPKPVAEEGSDAGNGEAGDETDKEADEAEAVPPPPRNYVHLACVHCKEKCATFAEADEAEAVPPPPRNYVHLACVHCKEKCATFAGYTKHLMSNKHRLAMGHAHNLTETHRAMKRFLMPFCRVCRVSFRSPMLYEHHICSLEHLKRKASAALRRASPKPDEEDASGDEGMDVDLDNFMTLDSVGDVDEVEDDDSGGEKKEESAAKKPKVEINIGNEHIKKLQVLFCELCQLFLPRNEPGSPEEAEAVRRHCRLRRHLSRYLVNIYVCLIISISSSEEQKENAENAAVKEEKAEAPADESAKKLENGTDAANASGSEDKLWADVDKDLGELLSEVDPQGHEGSDDEEDLGRYDKFRKSDKKAKVVDGEEGEEVNAADEAAETKTNEIDAPA